MAGRLTKGHKWLVALTVLFVAIGATIGIVSVVQERELTAKIAKAKADGFPFKGSDISDGLIDQRGQNAAPSYSYVRAKIASIKFADVQLGRYMAHAAATKSSMDEGEWSFLDLYLAEYSPILDEFERGARMDYCYFDKDWDRGNEVQFPELSDIKQAAKHFAARIRLNARRGDTDAVERDLQTLLKLAEHVQTQPAFIPFIVSIKVNGILISAISAELTTSMEDPAVRHVFREAVVHIPEQWDVSKLIEAQAFIGYWDIENGFATGKLVMNIGSDGGSADSPVDKLKVKALSTGVAVRQMKSSVIDLWSQIIQDYEVGDDESELFTEIESRIATEKAESTVLDYFYSIVSPSYSAISSLIDSARAKRRSLLAAFDVMDFRDEHGEWPAVLPVEYTDPFDDHPLRYKLTTDGFRVWSIGHDREDNGGTTRDEDRFGYDVVVVFPSILQPFESMFGGPGPPGAGVPAVGLGSLP